MMYYKDSITEKTIEFKNRTEMEEYMKNTPIQEITVLKNTESNFGLNVTPDRDRFTGVGGAYFKWVNNVDFHKATEIARILFNTPEYTEHKNTRDGKKNVTLKSKQKKELMILLSSNITSSNSIRILGDNVKFPTNRELLDYIDTTWKLLIYNHNIVNGINENIIYDSTFNKREIPKMMLPLDLPIPNYMDL